MQKVHLRLTCVALKHTSDFLYFQTPRALDELCGEKNICKVAIYHSTEFKQKQIKWWSIIGVLQYMAIILNNRFFLE